LEPGQIGVIFAFTSILNGAASLLTPPLARRIGKVRTVVATQLASIPFLLVLTFSYDLRWATVAYYARSALMNMGGPVSMAFALERVAPHRRATLSSLEAMLGSLGRGGLGPVVSGLLQVRGGFEPAFSLTTACYVVATALYWWFFKEAERPQAPSSAMASTSTAAPRGSSATATVERAGAASGKNSA
ncbi:MAG TPA: MFS transporter, partial [Limnochordales bacterium]